MYKTFSLKPLGQVLQQADLISSTQIDLALQEQTQTKNIRFGEILALRGWIKQETVDFFAEKWPTLLRQKWTQPLGYYLKEAGLLNEHQITTILDEQGQKGLRFGEIAVLKGWIKPTTINFFLKHITSGQAQVMVDDSQEQTKLLNARLERQQKNSFRLGKYIPESESIGSLHHDLAQLRLFIRSTIRLFKLDKKASRPEILLEQVLLWAGNQAFFTQKICKLISESEDFIAAGEEADKVRRLVKTHLISDWENQAAGEHLQEIRDGLLKNSHCHPTVLLKLYQQILQQREVLVDDSQEQAELLKLGLVVQQKNKLKVSNRIYKFVFNANWVEKELSELQTVLYGPIELFNLEQKASCPDIVLEEVLFWTNGQPFLTQQVCQLVSNSENFIPAGEEVFALRQLVQNYIINNWETQEAAEHLRAVRDSLIENSYCNPISLLKIYRQILQNQEILVDHSQEQIQLISLGIVEEHEDKLRVSNRLYQSVFDLNWVEQELEKMLQPRHSKIPKTFSSKPISELPISQIKSVVANTKGMMIKTLWIFLGISALTIVGFSVFKRLEVTLLFHDGNKLFNQQEYKKAIARYDKLLNIDSNYYQAWTNRGYALAGLQEYNKMLESCSTATIIEPKATYAWNCQGEALYNLKQYYEAISAFDTAIAMDPKNPIFWINKTESLLALKQSDTALLTIDEAISLLQKSQTPDNQESHARMLSVAFSHKGKVLSQKQQHNKALEAYDQALTYDPRYFTAQRGRGIALRSLKRYTEANVQFQQILNESQLSDAQKAEIWFYIGMTFCNSSQFPEGITALETAIKAKADYQAAEQAKANCTF